MKWAESYEGNKQWGCITGIVYRFFMNIIISRRKDIEVCVCMEIHHAKQTICLLLSDYSSCDHPGSGAYKHSIWPIVLFEACYAGIWNSYSVRFQIWWLSDWWRCIAVCSKLCQTTGKMSVGLNYTVSAPWFKTARGQETVFREL